VRLIAAAPADEDEDINVEVGGGNGLNEDGASLEPLDCPQAGDTEAAERA
jgi:hypothetical protein